jgi:hypothetical protein
MCQVRRLAFPLFRAASGMPSVSPLMELLHHKLPNRCPRRLLVVQRRNHGLGRMALGAERVVASPARFQNHHSVQPLRLQL